MVGAKVGGWNDIDPDSGIEKRNRISELLYSKENEIGLRTYLSERKELDGVKLSGVENGFLFYDNAVFIGSVAAGGNAILKQNALLTEIIQLSVNHR